MHLKEQPNPCVTCFHHHDLQICEGLDRFTNSGVIRFGLTVCETSISSRASVGNKRIAGEISFASVNGGDKAVKNLSLNIIAAASLFAGAGVALPAYAADNTQTAEEYRTSKIVGSKVYNDANENIGSVEDIILKSDGSMDEVILSVGGFLGIADKYVAVPFSDLKVTRDGSSLKINTNGTKESLKALPDYKFFKS